MSGATPRHGFTCPAEPAEDVGIKLGDSKPVLEALRNEIVTPRSESMRWVSDDFDALAQDAFEIIGSPSLNAPLNGWSIFQKMLPHCV